MRRVRAALKQAVKDLGREGIRFALVGGFAVSARAEPRTTRDVDIAVAVREDAEAEQIVFRLGALGYVFLASVEQTATRRLATARLRAPKSNVVIDLLFASSSIESELVSRADALEVLRGVRMPVARLSDLVALKVLARDDHERPQDAQDLRALLKEASEQQLEEARAALRLIGERGAARGKDLERELDRARRELGPR